MQEKAIKLAEARLRKAQEKEQDTRARLLRSQAKINQLQEQVRLLKKNWSSMNRRKNDTDMSYCIRNGVKAYPVKKGRQWKVEVDYGGAKPKLYKKPIGEGGILRGKKAKQALEATYCHWAKKIEKKHEAIKKSGDRQPTDKVHNQEETPKAGQEDR